MNVGDVVVGNGFDLDVLPTGSVVRRVDGREHAAIVRVGGLWSRIDTKGRPTGDRFGVGWGHWRREK